MSSHSLASATVRCVSPTARGIDVSAAIERYRPDGAAAADRAAEAAAFASRVYRVFEEMREEALAGESQDSYLAVVDRAFAEL